MSTASLLLSAHLLGALVSLGAVGVAIYSLLSQRSDWQRTTACALGYCTLVQVASGCLLSLAARDSVSIGTFCVRIGLYLGILGSVELLLLVSLRARAQVFPGRLVAQTFSASLVLGVLTIPYLL